MRPTTSTMLQQNNNNNYPCLNMSGSTGEVLQKCSRAPVPFPSRLELSLGDLPLVRGLRAWALCSKNRRKAGGELGGGQAPKPPPVSREKLTSCPRPADVYPAGKLGSMGYGLPMGLDARQAGIGALVTVATLKTSDGGGKTQTQCLFLRTEKGSCLYSTKKPGLSSLGMSLGVTTSGASTLVGSWLRGRVGGGAGGGRERETQAARRANGPPPTAQTGSSRVRMRSGRRWRKSCGAAGQDRAGLGRKQRSREEASADLILKERQEEGDKGEFHNNLPSARHSLSPEQEGRSGSKQERAGANRSSRHCHDTRAKSCTRCARREGRDGKQPLEEDRSQGQDMLVQNRLNDGEEGMTKEEGAEVKEGSEKREVNRSDIAEAISLRRNGPIPVGSSLDPEINLSRRESLSRGEAVTETNVRLQSPNSCGETFRAENEGETQSALTHVAGQLPEKTTGGCDGNSQIPVTLDLTPEHSTVHEDGNRSPPVTPSSTSVAVKPGQKTSGAVEADINGFSNSGALDTVSRQESQRLRDRGEDERNSVEPAQSFEASRCCDEGQFPLSSVPSAAPASYSNSEASGPAEGSTSTAEQKPGGVQGQENRSADGNQQKSNRETLEQPQIKRGDTWNVDDERLIKELGSDRSIIKETNCEEFHIEEPGGEGTQLKVVNDINEKFDKPLCQDGEAKAAEDRGPWRPRGETLLRSMKLEEGREAELGNATSCPALRQVDGHGGMSVSETDDGMFLTSAEKEGKRSGGGKEATEEGTGEEAEGEDRGEKERVAGHKEEEVLQSGGVATDDDKQSSTEEKPKEETDGSIREEVCGEANNGTERHCLTDWRTGGSCSLQPSDEPPAEDTAGAEERKAETCCSLRLGPGGADVWRETSAVADPPKANTHSAANPAPTPSPLGAMATSLPRPEARGGPALASTLGEGGGGGGEEGGGDGEGWASPEEPGLEDERHKEGNEEQSGTLATELGERRADWGEEEEEWQREEVEQEEEDEFGVFMQAEGEPGWSEGFAPSAPVPCGNTESDGDSTHWTSGWTGVSFHPPDDNWTAFSQDSSIENRDPVGQWWPVGTVEESTETLSSNQNLIAVFTQAFPSQSHCVSDAVPTLTQLLQGDQRYSRTSQDQGLLDNFHDLNKMIGQRNRRANGESRNRLLRTLSLEPACAESRGVTRVAGQRLSPGRPSADQHAQHAAAKRRPSYDHNRNVME